MNPLSLYLEDRIDDLGGLSTTRVRSDPAPGRATLADVIDANRWGMGLFELIDRTLVQKAMGWQKSYPAGILIQWPNNFVETHSLGWSLVPTT